MHSNGNNPIPPHVQTEREREVYQLITRLLEDGGRVIVGNEWKNRKDGTSYFEVKIEHRGHIHPFELDECIPMTFARIG